jgi:hypothetical protein
MPIVFVTSHVEPRFSRSSGTDVIDEEPCQKSMRIDSEMVNTNRAAQGIGTESPLCEKVNETTLTAIV